MVVVAPLAPGDAPPRERRGRLGWRPTPEPGFIVNGAVGSGQPFEIGGRRRPYWGYRYAFRLLWIDAIAVLWASIGAHAVNPVIVSTELSANPLNPRYVAITLVMVAAWLLVLDWGGSRDVRSIGHGPDEYKRVVNSTLALFGALAIVSYLFRFSVPRSYLVIMMPSGILALIVGRFLARRWLHRQRGAGRLMSDVLVVGTARSVKDLLCDLKRTPSAGYRVIGVCIRDGEIVDGLPRADAGGTLLLNGVPILADSTTSSRSPVGREPTPSPSPRPTRSDPPRCASCRGSWRALASS